MSESRSDKKSYSDWGFSLVTVLLLILFTWINYKALGSLGKALIITIVIWVIILALVEALLYSGLFLKIARKIGSKLKKKGGPDVRH